jgi:hypothetical protein
MLISTRCLLLRRNLGTRACTVDAVLTAKLNDKSSFSELCEGLGILVPKSFPITTKERLYELNNKCALGRSSPPTASPDMPVSLPPSVH